MQDRKLVVGAAAFLLSIMLVAGGFANTIYGSIVEVDQFPNSQARVVLSGPSGTETLQLTGPTTVLAFTDLTGSASDTDAVPDGLDQIPTEIVSMQLTGISPLLGPVELRAGSAFSLPPSRGEIEEKVNNNPNILDIPPFTPSGSADSFFDVFFEIELPDLGLTLQNRDPLRVQTQITNKPPAPGEQYCETGPVDLFVVDLVDGFNNLAQIDGQPLAQLIQACHTPNPPPPVGGEILPIDMTSLLVAGAFTSTYWILPMIGGIGGAVAGAVIAIRVRRRKIN